MIIVLGFAKEDVASAQRLATRYHEIIVMKDVTIKRKQYDFQKVEKSLSQEDLAEIDRISVLGHSNSTSTFGSYTVAAFADFICNILRVNGGRLGNLTSIDLLGCEVGRTEHREISDALETKTEYRSFVSDFVTELSSRVSTFIEKDLNIYAFLTPDEHIYRKTLLYEDLQEDERQPGTWQYLGLTTEQYNEFISLEREEKMLRIALALRKSDKAEYDSEIDSKIERIESFIPPESYRSSEHALIRENLNLKLTELRERGLRIDAAIQDARQALQNKHFEIRTYLLNNSTALVSETDDPRRALQQGQIGRFVISKENFAEEKHHYAAPASGIEDCISEQLELKEKLSGMKNGSVSSDSEEDEEMLSIPKIAPGKDR